MLARVAATADWLLKRSFETNRSKCVHISIWSRRNGMRKMHAHVRSSSSSSSHVQHGMGGWATASHTLLRSLSCRTDSWENIFSKHLIRMENAVRRRSRRADRRRLLCCCCYGGISSSGKWHLPKCMTKFNGNACCLADWLLYIHTSLARNRKIETNENCENIIIANHNASHSLTLSRSSNGMASSEIYAMS